MSRSLGKDKVSKILNRLCGDGCGFDAAFSAYYKLYLRLWMAQSSAKLNWRHTIPNLIELKQPYFIFSTDLKS